MKFPEQSHDRHCNVDGRQCDKLCRTSNAAKVTEQSVQTAMDPTLNVVEVGEIAKPEEAISNAMARQGGGQGGERRGGGQGQQGRGGRGGGQGGGGGLFRLLDVDRDGQLSAKEIDGAIAVLAKLDADNDGILDAEELNVRGGGRAQTESGREQGRQDSRRRGDGRR